MTSRREVKKMLRTSWRPSWRARMQQRYRRAIRSDWPLWLYFFWAQPESLHGRFDHARVLARKPRAGRRRR